MPGSPNLAPFHIWAPLFVDSIDAQPASITDFNGDLAVADVTGTGMDGNGNTLYFAADLRFMDGLYQDVNGNTQHGTFALV